MNADRPPRIRSPLLSSIGRSAMSLRASGEGGASGVFGTPFAQAAFTIDSQIGNATLPPVLPPPSVRRVPPALS